MMRHSRDVTTDTTLSPGDDVGYCLSRTFLSVAAFSSADICFGPSFTVSLLSLPVNANGT